MTYYLSFWQAGLHYGRTSPVLPTAGVRESNRRDPGSAGGEKSVRVCCWISFCCSGQHQETRQAKDHPKAAYEAWHTAWRYPYRARRDWQSQAHLHTTLNKSRDEKLEIVGVWPAYPFGKRACIMGEGPGPAAGVGNRTRGNPGSAERRFPVPDLQIQYNRRRICYHDGYRPWWGACQLELVRCVGSLLGRLIEKSKLALRNSQ